MRYIKLDVTNLHPPGRAFHHWCPHSQSFASTSQFVSALLHGWHVNTLIIRKKVAYGQRGMRHSHVYYVELRQNDDYMTMPVLASPSLDRLLYTGPFEIVEYNAQPAVTPAQSDGYIYIA